MKNNFFPRLTRFRINFFSGIIAMGVCSAIQIALIPVILSKLGSELYGLWAVLSTLMVIGNFGDQGLGDALIRQVAMAHARGDREGISTYFNTAMMISLGFGLLAASLIVVSHTIIIDVTDIPANFHATATDLLYALALLLVLFLVRVVTDATLTGLGRIDYKNGLQVCGRVLQAIIVVGCLYADLGIWSVWWGQFVLLIFSIIVGTILVIRLTDVKMLLIFNFSTAKACEMAKMGSYMILARILQIGLVPLMRVVVSSRFGLDFVTYFDVGFKAVTVSCQIMQAGIKAIVPRVSAADIKGLHGLTEVKDLNRRVIWLVIIVVTPIFIVLYLFGGDLLSLWLHDTYHPVMLTTMRFLLLPYLANMMIITMYYTVIGWGKTDMCALVALISLLILLVGLAANTISGYRFGYEGLLVAYGASVLLGAGAFLLIYLQVVKSRERVAI